MLTFISDEFKNKVQEIISFLTEHRFDYEFYNIEQPEDYEDIVIGPDTNIGYCLPYCEDDYTEKPLFEVLEMIEEIGQAKIIEDYKYISPKRILVRVDSNNRDKIIALDSNVEDIFETSLTINNQVFNFDLVKNDSNFGVLITVIDDYDKYFPPILFEDLFIEVTSDDLINEQLFDDLVQAYLFELSSSLNIQLYTSPRPSYSELEYELQDGEDKIRLRPLVSGRGNKELYSIYNSSAGITDPEVLILIYTKVIEFVSQTVVRRELLDTVITKLYSPKTLAPDAVYVLELEKLFDDLGNYKRDKEAIRITVETCCEISELKDNVPKYLRNLKKINLESNREEKKQALIELSNAISDTRNMIAHAKTNYKFKGYECPQDEIRDFSICLKIIADQVIRWFARQHDDSKVI